jgi:hypothetical protein
MVPFIDNLPVICNRHYPVLAINPTFNKGPQQEQKCTATQKAEKHPS